MVLLKSFEMLSRNTFQNSTLNPYYIIWQQKVKLYQSKVDEVGPMYWSALGSP